MAKQTRSGRARSGRGVEGRPGRRYELTDEAWQRIEPLLPTQRRGGKWADHRTVLNGMFWVLNAGAWRGVPEEYFHVDRGLSTLVERGIKAVIPTRSNQRRLTLDRATYRRRNAVERCIGWLKECRRVATRYEKLATHYLAFLKLARIQRCLRLLDPSNRT